MRGEKNGKDLIMRGGEGSPPHARGKVSSLQLMPSVLGITPACAGKSLQPQRSCFHGRDHPRMRGEKQYVRGEYIIGWGSPPHARGKVRLVRKRRDTGRITPACAGKRFSSSETRHSVGDHPRMRGEKRTRRGI